MLTNYLSVALIGFFVSLFFIFLLKKGAIKDNILLSQGVPLIGGIAIGLSSVVAYLIGVFIFGILSEQMIGIVLTSFIMLVFGMLDDWHEFSVMMKFLVQLIAASLLILFGVRTQIIHIGSWLNIIITLVWILGVTNAFNHLDVMDGLSAGTAAIVSLAFLAISLLNGDIGTATLILAIIGAIFGFLLYNLPPAKIYMGNSGSHFLGFLLAAVALVISYAPLGRKIALLSPLFILGLPLFDTALLIFMRISKKKIPFKKSNDHLALRFLSLGYSKKKALLAMLSLGLLFSLSGITLTRVPGPAGTMLVIFVIAISLTLVRKMSRIKFHG